jgi:hypothetical protein
MRLLLTLGLFIIVTRSHAFTFDIQDSIKVDKRKVERLIKEIKKRPEIKNYHKFQKDFRSKDISFRYPKSTISDKGFTIELIWRGDVILMYDVNDRTYELGTIIDLR